MRIDMLTKEAKNILVIQLAGLGDMVLATPTLSELRQLYPHTGIFLLTNSRSADIVRGSPDIDGIFIADNLAGFLKLIKKIRSCHFDLVINLYRLHSFRGAIKMLLLFSAIGGKYWVGRNTDGRGFFYHLKVKEQLSDTRHEVEHKLDIITALGGKIKDINFKLGYDKENELFIRGLLKKEGIREEDTLIGINCTTVSLGRNWTAAGYHQLTEQLIRDLPVKVVFCGSRLNRKIFDDIKIGLSVRVIDLVGRLTVKQLVAFIRRCNLFISPDSGPAHIASVLKVPLVSLFGEGEYDKFRPYGDEKKIRIIRTPLKLITGERVAEQVKQLLKEYA